MKVKLIFILILATAQMVCGQEVFEKVGTSGAQFLDIPMDAGVVAMGNAYVAQIIPNANAVLLNPATLVYLPSWSAHFGSVQYFADINLTSAAFAYNLGALGTVGFAYKSLNSGAMKETTVDAQRGTGNTFEWTDMLLSASYARSFTDNFSFGMNLNYVNESIAAYDLSAAVWAIDLGTFYQTAFRSLRLGMTIRNFGPELDFNTSFTDYNNGEEILEPSEYHPYHLPLTFQVGVAYDFFEDLDNHLLTVEVDAVHPNEAAERLNIGFDYKFMNAIHIRSGGYTNHNTAGLMGGVGLEFDKVGYTGRFDYSVSSYDLLGAVHQFSMIISR